MHDGAVGLFHRKQRQDFQIVMYQRSSQLLEIRQRDPQDHEHFRGADGISIRLYVFAHNNLRIFLPRQSRSQELNSVICARVLRCGRRTGSVRDLSEQITKRFTKAVLFEQKCSECHCTNLHVRALAFYIMAPATAAMITKTNISR